MSLYSSNIEANYLERATLLEDIILPEFPPFPTMQEIHDAWENGTEVYYPRPEELYEDTIGKFSIPILAPLSDYDSDPTDKSSTSTVKNIVNKDSCNLTTSSYEESNYLELNIPKYILLNFISKVPAGTVFIVGFIGGSTTVGDIKILGVSEFDAESVQ